MTIPTRPIGPLSPHDDTARPRLALSTSIPAVISLRFETARRPNRPDYATMYQVMLDHYTPLLRQARAEAARCTDQAAMHRILLHERDDRLATLQARIDVQDAILDGRERLIYALQCRERHRQTVRAGRSPLLSLARLTSRIRRSLARHPSITRLAVAATVLMLAILGLQYLPGW